MGLGIVAKCLVEPELESGALVAVPLSGLLSQRSYYFVFHPEKARVPTLAIWRNWIISESARSLGRR
ncbi:LysR substrate-binding domain-containing protein [Robbsia andropogonis]|uniref:LysR substrate-binding domain-containing protein n=1 Tax=Robbsia andropogonis TaxID=28092 RepID=UPI0009E4B628